MTIEFLSWDVTPSSPIWHYQENFEDIERIFPLDADWIERVWASSIDWSDGTVVPIENLPIDDIRDALAGGSGAVLTDIGVLTILPQWKSDSDRDLYIMPGMVAHRGSLKRQALDEGTSSIRVVDVSSCLRDAVADSGAGNNGLSPDTWYYVYAQVDVATTYPAIKVSKQAPTYDNGYGPEHPTDTTYRFIGSFRTGEGPGAAIVPHHRFGDGRVIYRMRVLGPNEPTTNLLTGDTSGFQEKSLDTVVPPTADAVFLTASMDSWKGGKLGVRAVGDTGDVGYLVYPTTPASDDDRISTAWMEVPVNTLDANDNQPFSAAVDVSLTGYSNTDNVSDSLAVVGYHEKLF